MVQNIYQFEEFTDFGSKYSYKISLGKSGFGFGSGFITRNKLQDYKAIKLYFDRDRNAVGFRFIKESEDGAKKLKMRPYKGFVSAHLVARTFISKYDIHVSNKTERYEPVRIDDGKGGQMFVIELQRNGKND